MKWLIAALCLVAIPAQAQIVGTIIQKNCGDIGYYNVQLTQDQVAAFKTEEDVHNQAREVWKRFQQECAKNWAEIQSRPTTRFTWNVFAPNGPAIEAEIFAHRVEIVFDHFSGHDMHAKFDLP
jgi:hypothetical protein